MDSNVASVVAGLIANGLPKVADAVVEKGIDPVQEKLGIALKPESQLTPADIQKLQEAANKHEEFMAEIDEKSRARASDMAIHAMDNQDPVVRRFIYYFAWFWSIVSILYFFGITFVPMFIGKDIPQSAQNFANTILGFLLGTTVASIIQFFYGSSKSSQDKTAAMSAMRGQMK